MHDGMIARLPSPRHATPQRVGGRCLLLIRHGTCNGRFEGTFFGRSIAEFTAASTRGEHGRELQAQHINVNYGSVLLKKKNSSNKNSTTSTVTVQGHDAVDGVSDAYLY